MPDKNPKVSEIFRKKGADAFILAMATGSSMGEASRKAGITERTGYTRLRDETWLEAIEECREKIVGKATERIQSNLTKAVDELADLLGDDSGTVRLGAARALLDFGLRYRPGGEASTQNVNMAPVKAELDLSQDALAVVKALAIEEGE